MISTKYTTNPISWESNTVSKSTISLFPLKGTIYVVFYLKLDLANFNLHIGEFFAYNWLNLEFLSLSYCNIDDLKWEKFAFLAKRLLPNILALDLRTYRIKFRWKQNYYSDKKASLKFYKSSKNMVYFEMYL